MQQKLSTDGGVDMEEVPEMRETVMQRMLARSEESDRTSRDVKLQDPRDGGSTHLSMPAGVR